jgi:hypothetical protein
VNTTTFLSVFDLWIFLVTILSFSLTCLIYWFLVRPFNVVRVLFGMRSLKRERQGVKTSGPSLAEPSMIHEKSNKDKGIIPSGEARKAG